MIIRYGMVRPDLEEAMAAECDTYKFDTHPVTGKFTLHLYAQHGAQSQQVQALSGVVWFAVERP